MLDLLADSPHLTAKVAAAVIVAADQRLDQLANETAVPYCYWLLVRLAAAARGDDFEGDAKRIGAPLEPNDSAIGFIARVSQDVSDTLRRSPGAGPFAELAVESFRATLLHSITMQGQSLFGNSPLVIQAAFRRYSTERGFGTLVHAFFGDFISRTLRYFLDREIGNHIGPAYGLATVDDAREFVDALDVHARETARMVEVFASEWFSLHNWQAEGEVSRQEAEGFVGRALSKIRSELVQEASAA